MGTHGKSRRVKSTAAVVGVLVVAATAVTLTSTNAAPRKTGPGSVTATLREKAAIPGTAWAVDPRTNKVVVTADSTVTGERRQTLVSTVDSLGEGAGLTRTPGVFRAFAEGGDAIFGGGGRCSLGFNVTAADGRPGFLTAGHCAQAAQRFSLR